MLFQQRVFVINTLKLGLVFLRTTLQINV